jgi:Protein of unknown function (DUF2934)
MKNTPSHEDIEVRAYELYLDCGCGDGHELQHWLEAERQLSEPEEETSDSSADVRHKSAAAGSLNR